MKKVNEKKYLGRIISNNITNEKNLKDKTNRYIGNITKIVKTLSERSFGPFTFKATKLMRDGILISSLVNNNAETWISLTPKKNVLEIEKPDKVLQ